MDYVIDIQGLRDKDNKFLPKEVAVVSLQEQVIGHWIIAPPYEFDNLPEDIKTSNDYVSSRLHGLQWFDGDVILRKLRYHFYNIARNAVRIYVRGAEKARYIESIMARNVINIEDYTTTGFTDLQRQFPSQKICCFHACQENLYKKEYCAMQRSHLLREWLYSLLPQESQQNLPKRSCELFYDSLQKLAYKKNSIVRFGSSVTFTGIDEVDDDDDDDDKTIEYASDDDQNCSLTQENNTNEHQSDNEGPGRAESQNNWRIRSRSNSECNDNTGRCCV